MDLPTAEELERFLAFDMNLSNEDFSTSFPRQENGIGGSGDISFTDLDRLIYNDFILGGEGPIHEPEGALPVQEQKKKSYPLQGFNSLVCAHPLYPNLLNAHFQCKMVGLDRADQAKLQAELSHLVETINSSEDVAAIRAGAEFCNVESEIRRFIEDYCKSLESLKADLEGPYLKAKQACEMFDKELQMIREGTSFFHQKSKDFLYSARSDSDLLSVDHNAELRQQLKRRYSESLQSLRKEFSKRVKKGKLPDSSSCVLKDWWNQHLVYPYPTEEEKIALEKASKLTSTQVNNWFINMRKRHWHKLFPEGIPENERVAEASLRERGMLCKLYQP